MSNIFVMNSDMSHFMLRKYKGNIMSLRVQLQMNSDQIANEFC